MEIKLKSIQQAVLIFSIDGHKATVFYDTRNGGCKIDLESLAPFPTSDKIAILRNLDEITKEALADNRQRIIKTIRKHY